LLELYRRKDLVMAPGSRIQLQGLVIEVRALTSDRRVAAARFRFDRALDEPSLCLLYWDQGQYRRFVPPAVSQRIELPPAVLFAQ
jgi:hypothetical protein